MGRSSKLPNVEGVCIMLTKMQCIHITNIAFGGVIGETGGGVGLFFQSSLSSISEMYVLF